MIASENHGHDKCEEEEGESGRSTPVAGTLAAGATTAPGPTTAIDASPVVITTMKVRCLLSHTLRGNFVSNFQLIRG